eukprot:665696-Rhodomonas_salina.1
MRCGQEEARGRGEHKLLHRSAPLSPYARPALSAYELPMLSVYEIPVLSSCELHTLRADRC